MSESLGEIAAVEPSAARRAPHEMFRLRCGDSIGRFPDIYLPRGMASLPCPEQLLPAPRSCRPDAFGSVRKLYALIELAVRFRGPSRDRQGTAMAGKIFINYRREDSIATAGRLADRLTDTFGRDNLFMDVDNIPVGINFDEYLKSQVAACDVVLSVIGPNWLNAKDETNQRRLDKPDDFVAIELAPHLPATF